MTAFVAQLRTLTAGVPLTAAFLVLLTSCSSTATDPATVEPTPVESSIMSEAAATPEPTAPAACSEQCAGAVAEFDVETLSEASGAAMSGRDPNLLWVLDDGPGTTSLLGVYLDPQRASTASSRPAVRIHIAGMEGQDTEALAAGACAPDDPRPCLFIGDIGDNRRTRDDVVVHRVVEPVLTSSTPPEPIPAATARFVYPDGSTDAEAMFVTDGRLFIVTKAPFDSTDRETGSTHLLEAPFFTDSTLLSRGVVPVPRPEFPLAADLVGNVVTGADATGARVLLRTYDHALMFTAPSEDADIAEFPTWPVEEVPTDGPLQTEAVAFDTEGCAHLTVGEQSGLVWRTPC